jgi:Tfp pilus assembly protein PilF
LPVGRWRFLLFLFAEFMLMKIAHLSFLVLLLSLALFSCTKKQPVANEFTGSETCLQCHEKFYELWSTSHHGKAMQPLNPAFLRTSGIKESTDFQLEGKTYSISLADSAMNLVEKADGKIVKFPVLWVLGGKNVYYFLTTLDRGILQTIPLAFDVRKNEWYNNPQSAMRHFPEGPADQALPWKDRMYSFNTSCYSCHISQLETNFDLATDSYKTTWREPGINCETCHGPSGNHVTIFKNTKEGEVIKELGLISTKTFTHEQHNWSCAPCHAKMHSITPSYMPGDRFFDNYNLTVLDNPDFYPDGRDLGENYTYTGWMMNKCAANSEMHCVTCHTSSGRDRFKNNPNDACMKCHTEQYKDVAAHSGHKTGSAGAVCINCHMPKTEFGKMVRSDHSFRPPMPEATIRFGSPNACNICHSDKTPQWANEVVKKRENSNYQEATIQWATLLRDARQGEWKQLGEMLDIIKNNQQNEVVVASFIRVLERCEKPEKWTVIMEALNNQSPLVRASAAAGLAGNTNKEARKVLLQACTDEYRLVRVTAAGVLSQFAPAQLTAAETENLNKATQEYMTSLVSRPDDWSSHYNLGIYYQNKGDNEKALGSYETAALLYPESLMPLINSSVLYSYIGNNAKAEENLQKALSFDPGNEAANLNYGLLLAELGRTAEAEKVLKQALQTNPKQAVAAYNLSVIASARSLDEAVGYAEIAANAASEEPKYAYTLAYYQLQNNKKSEAIKTLQTVIKTTPNYLSAVSLLADIYMKDGKRAEALKLYKQTLSAPGITEQDKASIRQAMAALEGV